MSVLLSLFAIAASQAVTNTAEPKPAPEKKICRVDPEDTDSRIRRRICKTASEWAGGSNKEGQDNQQSPSRDR